jgi:hypothetical protein
MSLLLFLHDLYSCTNLRQLASVAVGLEDDRKVVRAQLKRGPCKACDLFCSSHMQSPKVFFLYMTCSSSCLSACAKRGQRRPLPAV